MKILKKPRLFIIEDEVLIAELIDGFLSDMQYPVVGKFRKAGEAIKALQKMPWTGNIRELRNVVERLAILCDNKVTGEDVVKYAQPLMR